MPSFDNEAQCWLPHQRRSRGGRRPFSAIATARRKRVPLARTVPRAGLAPGVVLLALFHSSHFTLGFLRVSLLADQASHWWQQSILGMAPDPDGVPISV